MLASRRHLTVVFRVSVSCDGILPTDWPDALDDVAQEFKSRPWQKGTDCHWDGVTLVLVADNDYDYDYDGEALAAEFSDTVAAYAPGTPAPGYRVRILSVSVIGAA